MTTDHGHLDDGGHGGYTEAERTTFVVASHPLRRDTALVDVAATVLHHMGIAIPDWMEGRPALAD